MNRQMTDEQYTAEVDRIDRMVNFWLPLLGLDAWEVRVVFDDVGEVAASWEESSQSPIQTLADIDAQWEYMKILIRVNVLCSRDTDDSELLESICHEMCHALVCEMRSDDSSIESVRHEERVVTQLARSFCRVYAAGKDAA